MYANRRNFRVIEEIGVEEHDGVDRKWKYGRFAHAQCIRPYLMEQFVHYGHGYGADPTFHRTHF